MKEVMLGLNEYKNTLSVAEVDEKNVIRRLKTLDIIHKDTSYDGNTYLTWSGSGFSDVHGQEFEEGQKLPKNFKAKIGKRMLKTIDDAYHADGSYCSKCGTFHDDEQYYDLSYVITSCGELYCKDCVDFEEMLTELKDADSLFTSKDVVGMEVPKEFEEIDVLFCDSSGFGSESERALTKAGAIARVKHLLKNHKGKELFCGLTGIGQFQVYVTVWAKKPVKKKKAA